MNTHDLELVILGMVLQNPELLKSLATRPGGVLSELLAGRVRKLSEILGPNMLVVNHETAANVTAEWNRRMAQQAKVRAAHQQLRMAQLGVET